MGAPDFGRNGRLCFSRESEDVSPSKLTWGPAFLLIEGQARELAAIKNLFSKAAAGQSVVADRPSLQKVFGDRANIGIELAMESL